MSSFRTGAGDGGTSFTVYPLCVGSSRYLGDRQGGNPTPATYSTDSEIPSNPRSFSISESLNAAVLNGASPSLVAVRHSV
jgi:hypothetical protein